MNNVIEMTLTDRIKKLLERYGSTQRWFIDQLIEADIEMTDTKLSNRMTGRIEWTEEEIEVIGKFLTDKFKI
jgi:predicted DNA-binding protein